MKKFIHQLFAILMVLVMLFDAAPMAALAEAVKGDGQNIVADTDSSGQDSDVYVAPSSGKQVPAVLPEEGNQEQPAEAKHILQEGEFTVEAADVSSLIKLLPNHEAIELPVQSETKAAGQKKAMLLRSAGPAVVNQPEGQQKRTSCAAYSINLTDGESINADTYFVPVDLNAAPIDVLNGVADRNYAVIDGVSCVLYHIHQNEAGEMVASEVAINDVMRDNSEIYGFTFTTDGFSDYVLQYTVDFHYNGVDFSMEGNTQMLLSDLIEQLNILNGDALLNVADVADVVFTDEHLVTVQQVSGLITYNNVENTNVGSKDFLLSSEAPFTTDEKLTITLEDGETIEVGVTDEPEQLSAYDIGTNGTPTLTQVLTAIVGTLDLNENEWYYYGSGVYYLRVKVYDQGGNLLGTSANYFTTLDYNKEYFEVTINHLNKLDYNTIGYMTVEQYPGQTGGSYFPITVSGNDRIQIHQTVDHHYRMLLSDLITNMQIKKEGSDELLSVDDVQSVTFDNHDVTVEQVTGPQSFRNYNSSTGSHETVEKDAGAKDFLLSSLTPFSNKELLHFVLTGGEELTIAGEPYVYSIGQNSDLSLAAVLTAAGEDTTIKNRGGYNGYSAYYNVWVEVVYEGTAVFQTSNYKYFSFTDSSFDVPLTDLYTIPKDGKAMLRIYQRSDTTGNDWVKFSWGTDYIWLLQDQEPVDHTYRTLLSDLSLTKNGTAIDVDQVVKVEMPDRRSGASMVTITEKTGDVYFTNYTGNGAAETIDKTISGNHDYLLESKQPISANDKFILTMADGTFARFNIREYTYAPTSSVFTFKEMKQGCGWDTAADVDQCIITELNPKYPSIKTVYVNGLNTGEEGYDEDVSVIIADETALNLPAGAYLLFENTTTHEEVYVNLDGSQITLPKKYIDDQFVYEPNGTEGDTDFSLTIVGMNPEYSGDGNITISSQSGAIHADNKTYPVTAVKEKAFRDNETIQTVTFTTSDDATITIGEYAFYNLPNLTSISGDGKVKMNSSYVIGNSNALKSITLHVEGTKSGISQSLTLTDLTLYMDSFAGVSLPNTSILENLELHGDFTDSNILNIRNGDPLKTLVIDNTAPISIGQSVFDELKALETVTITGGVTEIGLYAFQNDSALTTVALGVDGDNKGQDLTIGNYAFDGCTSLTSTVKAKQTISISGGELVIDKVDAGVALGPVLVVNDEFDDAAAAAKDAIKAKAREDYPEGTYADVAFYNIFLQAPNGDPVSAPAKAEFGPAIDWVAPEGVTDPTVRIYRYNRAESIVEVCEEATCVRHTENRIQWVRFKTNGFSTFGVAYDTVYHDDMFYYALDADNKATILKVYNDYTGDSLEISSATRNEDKFEVVGLAKEAIMNKAGIKSITFTNDKPFDVPYAAFCWMSDLESLRFQGTGKVTTSGNYAFYNDPKLSSVTVAGQEVDFGRYAFTNCSALANVVIAGKTSFADASLFTDAVNVALVQSPDSLPENALSGEKLETIYFGSAIGEDVAAAISNVPGTKTVYINAKKSDCPGAAKLDELLAAKGAEAPRVLYLNGDEVTRGNLYIAGTPVTQEQRDTENGNALIAPNGTKEQPFNTFAQLSEVMGGKGGKDAESEEVTEDISAIAQQIQQIVDGANVTHTVPTVYKKTVSGTYTAYVLNAVNVTDTEEWDSDDKDPIILYRDATNTGAMVNNTGTLTLKNVVLDGGGIQVNSPIVQTIGGSLTLDSGSVLKNNKNVNKGGYSEYGGGLSATNGATVTMKDGSVVEYNSSLYGGGIMLHNGSTLNMEGGEVRYNTAQAIPGTNAQGGGIMIMASTMNMTGGSVHDNKADGVGQTGYGISGSTGGGIKVGIGVTNPGHSTLNMTSGTVANNESTAEGGGINVESGSVANVSGGSITGNKSHAGLFGGGGFYVNGDRGYGDGVLNLTRAVVTGNTAGYEGGGLAACGTSTSYINMTNGSAIWGNSSEDGSEVFLEYASYGGLSPHMRAYVSPYMFDGTEYHWVDLGSGKEVNKGILGLLKATYRLDTSVTGPSSGAVIISGNMADTRGGGIGSNGTVSFGDKPNPTTVSVTPEIYKMVTNRDMRDDEEFTFDVYLESYTDKQTAVYDYGRTKIDYCKYNDVYIGQGTVKQVKEGKDNATLIENFPSYTKDVTAADLGTSFTLLVCEETQNGDGYLIDESTYYAFRYTIGMNRYGGLEAYLEYVSRGECGERDASGKPDFDKNKDYDSVIGNDYWNRVRDRLDPNEKAIFNNRMLYVDIIADKTWLNYDGSDTPPAGAKVVFELYADGNATGKTIELDGTVDENGEDTKWKATWKDLDIYQKETTTGKPIMDDAHRIAYTVKENSVEAGYRVYTSDAQTTPAAADNKTPAKIENEQQKGNLTVSKTVVSDAAADYTKVFSFTVTLGDISIGGDEGKLFGNAETGMTFKNGVATFELHDGESRTATGLPAGVPYTIVETMDDGFTTSIKGVTEPTVDDENKTVGTNGTITKNGDEVEFINTRETGDLEISKTLISDRAADADQVFTFTVTLDGLTDEAKNKTYSGVAFTDGEATIKLKGGESKTIEGLPTEITYTVTEANATGFELTGNTGDTGTIKTDKSEAKFTNTRETGDLKISKTLISGRAADADYEFEFTIKLTGLTDEAKNKTYGDVTFSGGEATIKLKGGESKTIEGLPTDITYTVTEADVTGFQMTGKTGDEGTITTTLSEAKFTNTRETGDLKISKTLISDRAADADQVFTFTVKLDGLTDEAKNKTYGDVTLTDGEVTIELKGGESKTIEGLPTEITYTVTEADATGFKLTGKTGDTGTIKTDKSEAKFTNTRKTGGLTVSKTVDSDTAAGLNASKDQLFKFTVKLTGLTADAQNKTYNGVQFTNGVATFTLKHGESKTISGLPTDAGYEVTEETVSGYTLKAPANASGTITEGTEQVPFTSVEFVNDKDEGDLTVKKIIGSVITADQDKQIAFTFTVKLDSETVNGQPQAINGTYGDMTFTDGECTFTLKHGESKTATGLPAGIKYTVTETHADFDTTSTNATGTISKDVTIQVEFTNTRKLRDLVIDKKVVSPIPAEHDEVFDFNVILTYNGTTLTNDFEAEQYNEAKGKNEIGTIEAVSGVYTVRVKGDSAATIKGVPVGTTYVIEEVLPSDSNFELTEKTKDQGGIIDGENKAEFTNTRKTGKIKIQKIVDSPVEADFDKLFTIAIQLNDRTINANFEGKMNDEIRSVPFSGGKATVQLKHNETITIDGLPLGMGYTVSETPGANFNCELMPKDGAGTVKVQGDANINVVVTNERKNGGLSVEKLVVSPVDEHQNRDFQFKVTLSGGSVKDGDYDDMTFTNNVATFTLKHGQKKTATGLPAGISYTVEEISDFFKASWTNRTGTISENVVASVVCTNTYQATGSTTLSAEKKLVGREMKSGDTWTLTVTATSSSTKAAPMPQTTTGTITKNNKSVDFGTISFTEQDIGNTYTYTITETGSIDNVANSSPKVVTVKVEYDDTTHGLKITNDSNEQPVLFTNTYTADGKIPLKALKMITGRDFMGAADGKPADEWKFTVTGKNVTSTNANASATLKEAPMPTRINVIITPTSGNNAEVDFGQIKFTQDDIDNTYEYTITESATPILPGVTNDTTARTVTVTVEYDETTKGLKITSSANSNPVVITNVYKAEGEITFKGVKTITGRAMTADDKFSFEITENGNRLYTVKNDQTGKIEFPTIKYTEKNVGTHVYLVKEISESGKGITKDDTTYTVTVNVADLGNGHLSVTAASGSDDPEHLDFNNPYEATGSLTLAGTKTITRRAMTVNDVFSFKVEEVVPAGQTGYSVTVYNDATGKINYPTISYKLADLDVNSVTGLPKDTVKTYKITETSSSGNGITADPTVYTVKANISDNGDGTLKVVKTIDSDDPTALNFNNPYNATGRIAFAGTKTLEGRTLTAQDEFTFEIKEIVPEGKIGFSATAKNDATGKIKYPAIPYTLDDEKNDLGEHTYTVKETSRDGKGVTVDTKEYTVIVNVTDNGNGTLKAVETADSDDPKALNFTNQYDAEGSITFAGTKQLNGRQMVADEFSFQIMEQVGNTTVPVGTVTNAADGKINYPLITYKLNSKKDDTGEHTYFVSELPAKDQYVDVSTVKHTIKVNVTDNGDGTLKAEPNEWWNKADFINTYKAEGEEPLTAEKKMEGRSFENGDEWTFTVTAGTDNAPMPEKTKVTITYKNADADDKHKAAIDFGKIKFTEADAGKTYIYTITETGKTDQDKNITNDTAKTVTIKITDNGDKTLTIKSSADDKPVVFTNIFRVSAETPLKAFKKLENRDFKKGDKWTFKVTAKDGAPMPEKKEVTIEPTEGKSADVDFGKITLTEADIGQTYTYTITESGAVPGVTNDKPKTVTVKVSYDKKNQKLVVDSSADEESEAGSVTFTNVYEPIGEITLSGTKTLEGRELQNEEFSFLIKDGNKTLATVKNDAEGKFSYTIKYTLADAGKTYNYHISEVKTDNPGVTFDTTSYTVKAQVSDEGTGALKVDISSSQVQPDALNFTNSYDPNGILELKATKHLAGRDFYEGDKFTFTLKPSAVNPDAPMPKNAEGKEVSEVTIKPASGSTAKVDFGKIQFTRKDIGKEYVYFVSEKIDGEYADLFKQQYISPDPVVQRRVTVKVEDGGKGQLTITSSIDDTPLVFTNTYEFATWIPLTAFKELQGRSFQKGDSWTFTVKPKEVNAPKLMDSSDLKNAKEAKPVTITPEKDNLATINLGYLHFDQNDIGKTYHYTIAESGNVTAVENDLSIKEVTVTVTYNPLTYEMEVVSSSGDQTTNAPQLTAESMGKKTDTVTFKNVYKATGSITFKGTKTLTGGDAIGRKVKKGEFHFEIKESGPQNRKWTVTNEADGTINFPVITYTNKTLGDYTYEISETKGDDSQLNYAAESYKVLVTVTDNGNGTLTATPVDGYDDSTKLDFVNTVKTGSLKINKTFITTSNNELKSATAEFTVTLEFNGKPVSGTFGDYTFDKDGKTTITVAHRETKEITGIPVGVKCTVTENTEDLKDTYTVATATISGEIKETASVANFKNERITGDLTIDKKVVNKLEEDAGKAFTFKVKLSDNTIIGTFKTVQTENGVEKEGSVNITGGEATVTVKDGTPLTIKGLPVGVGYTVTEAMSADDARFFKADQTEITGTITTSGATAAFTNTRSVQPGSLTVTKTVENAATDTTSFAFTVKLLKNETEVDETFNGKYGEMTFKDGVATFTIKSGGKITATGLPEGQRYQVTEGESTNYTQTSAVNASGTIAKTVTATFINNKVPTTNNNVGGGGGGTVPTRTVEPTATPEKGETDEPKRGAPTPTPTPETVTVSGRKLWEDNNNEAGKRPASITIHLMADSSAALEEVASKTVTEADGWSWSFTGLPAVDSYNLPIDYSIKEDPVAGYTTSYSGYDVINTTARELTSATIVKIWDDEHDADLMRPATLEATLYNGDKVVTKVYLSGSSDEWRATVNDLPVYENGQKITYTWKEKEVAGYTLTGLDIDGTVTTLTNMHKRPTAPPEGQNPGPQRGPNEEEIEGYGTPLGLGIIINHVGDCFD